MSERRDIEQRGKRKGGFLPGMLMGVVAGAVGGTVLLRRAAEADEGHTATAGSQNVAESAETTLRTVRQAPATVTDQVRDALNRLKYRWRQAMTEGKAAAAKREAELLEQLANDRQLSRPTEPVKQGTGQQNA